MAVVIWRHPKPLNAQGLCLGRTDLAVDPRRIRRLAYSIQAFARRQQLPARLYVSPLQRSWQVGHFLQQQGWEVLEDPALVELDFGQWEGLAWSEIPKTAIDTWCDNFLHSAPGQGESLAQLVQRVHHWLQQPSRTPRLVVGHAGWITAAQWVHLGLPPPERAQDWPAPPAYSQRTLLY